MPQLRPTVFALLLFILAGPGPVCGGGADPAPAAALERLKAAEAALHSGEIRYRVTTRTATWDGEVDLRVALAQPGKPFGALTARLQFTGDAWRVDSEFNPAAADGVRQVTQRGGFAGVRRTLQRLGDQLLGRIEPDGGSAALPTLEAVLRGRLWWELQGITWEGATEQPGGLLLRGLKGRREVEVLLDPQLGHRPTAITLSSRNADGETTVIQSMRIRYRPVNGIPYPETVQQVFVGRLGEGAHATLHELRVEEVRLNVSVPEAELRIELPRGALVTDVRGEIPIIYNLTEQELTLAEVRERAALKIAQLGAQAVTPDGGVALGQAAPAFELKDLDGRPVKLAHLQGRVVLLNWFASW